MNSNAMNPDNSAARVATAAEQKMCAASSRWWQPQLYRTEEAELVSASCQNDLLTINMATRREGWPVLTAVNVN